MENKEAEEKEYWYVEVLSSLQIQIILFLVLFVFAGTFKVLHY